MKIFKCDVCLSPFEPKKNKNINTVEFSYSDVNDSDYDSRLKSNDVDIDMPISNSSLYCFYHICPECVNILRNVLTTRRSGFGKIKTVYGETEDDE